jgi:hypothetical protein
MRAIKKNTRKLEDFHTAHAIVLSSQLIRFPTLNYVIMTLGALVLSSFILLIIVVRELQCIKVLRANLTVYLEINAEH